MNMTKLSQFNGHKSIPPKNKNPTTETKKT